jgi:hypothetical protein
MNLEPICSTGWTCSCDTCWDVHEDKEEADLCPTECWPEDAKPVEPDVETAYIGRKCGKKYWTWSKARFCCDEGYRKAANSYITQVGLS